MTAIATLIAAPGRLDDALVARARAALPGADVPRWLADGTAAELPYVAAPDTGPRTLAETLRTALAAPVDVVVQPAANRRKKLLLADMDSTMIGQECIDELADYAGLKTDVAGITERAMRGEIEFAPALRERVALLKDMPLSVIDDVIARRITSMPGARALVSTMRANGAYTCLVSGGFTLFTGRIAALLGFDEARANTLEIRGERLTGNVVEPVFGRAQKRAALLELRAQRGLAPGETLVAGDGANDIDMIAEAGLGVAFHAKPAVAAAAQARVDHADLTALLYVQGYRRDEFVEV
jgi:phosphoserine phosphatase